MQVDQVRVLLRSGAHATRENVSMDVKQLWTCQHIRLKQCREGAMIYTINDTYIGRALDKYDEISRDEVLFLQQLTRPGMTVLEVARISVSSRCRSVGSFTPAAGSLLSSRSGSCIRCCVGISRSTQSTTSLHTTAQPAQHRLDSSSICRLQQTRKLRRRFARAVEPGGNRSARHD